MSVYRATNSPVYHSSLECRQIKNEERFTEFEESYATEFWDKCLVCQGDFDPTKGQNRMHPDKIRELNAE